MTGPPDPTETTTWAVQAGSDGTWITVTSPYPNRDTALTHLAWRQDTALEGITHRLEITTTTITTTYEEPTMHTSDQ